MHIDRAIAAERRKEAIEGIENWMCMQPTPPASEYDERESVKF